MTTTTLLIYDFCFIDDVLNKFEYPAVLNGSIILIWLVEDTLTSSVYNLGWDAFLVDQQLKKYIAEKINKLTFTITKPGSINIIFS